MLVLGRVDRGLIARDGLDTMLALKSLPPRMICQAPGRPPTRRTCRSCGCGAGTHRASESDHASLLACQFLTTAFVPSQLSRCLGIGSCRRIMGMLIK
ncbi:hypothetical protein BD309DRAFT_957841 [Dichomitus squalens]|nr:hypothetical protein BD309DRAFT_957841 [Dichomitus squalens]